MTKKEKVEKLTFQFEKKYGELLLLRTGLAVINKILINKGIINEDDLLNTYIFQMKEYMKDLEDINKKNEI